MKYCCLFSRVIIIVLLLLLLSIKFSHAQTDSNKLISLELHDAILTDVLKQVAEHYSLWLWYSEAIVPTQKKVTVRLQNATLQEAMDAVLKGTDLAYSISNGNKLVLKVKRRKDQETGTIIGIVLDKKTKQPIPSANVVVMGTQLGGTTDVDGNYKIFGAEENIYKLKFSSLGYGSHSETDIRVIRGKTTTVKEIELSETAVTIDSIVVTAGFFSNDNVTPTTNFTYNREEIRRNPGTQGDIFRAIETLPGVGGSGGEFSAFAVRGSSPRDNIILIDNIPFDKVAHFVAGSEEDEAQGGRYSVFTPGLIDEAAFQAGGFAAKYGGKFSSILDLKIKEGNKESFTTNGSYDLFGWEANYDGPTYLFNNTSLLLSARHQDFAKVLELVGQKDVGQSNFSDIVAKTTTDISANHKLSLLGIYAPEHFDRTLDNILEAKHNDFGSFIGSVDETKYLFGANWRYLTSTQSFWENIFYYKKTVNEGKGGRVYINLVNGVVPAKEHIITRPEYIISKNNDDQIGVKSQFTFTPSPISTIQLGGEIFQIAYDYRYTQNGLDTLYVFDRNDYRPDPTKYYVVTDPQFVNSTQSRTKMNYAAFADYRYNITDILTVMPGVRYEYGAFNKQHYVSPRLSVRYQINERTKLNAATGVYYQAPEFRVFTLSQSNAILKNERAIHFIIGVSHYLGADLKLILEMYYKDLSNLIVHADRTTPIRTNKGTGFARGIDFGLIKKFSDQWYGQLNYSYSQSRQNNNDGMGEYNADFSQPHIFNILLGYELNKEWSFSAKWKFATGRPKDSYIIHSDIFNNPNFIRYSRENTGNNNERYPDFQTLNMRVDYRKQFGDVPLVKNLAFVAFLDILNFYNHPNTNSEELREFNGKVLTTGVGMLPTLGVKLEF